MEKGQETQKAAGNVELELSQLEDFVANQEIERGITYDGGAILTIFCCG